MVVNKSTVPVGTADVVRDTIAGVLAGRGKNIPFSVVSNPEFLKEGAAVADFMRPDRIIVGCDDHRATVLLRNLYAPFNRNRDRLIEMDVRSAELTKYAANAMLATKISFMNEIANLAERLGADVEKVRVGIGADPRIGYHFIYPGAGYGGSCFPKDVKALEYTARAAGYEAALLQAVEAVNERQKTVLFTKIQRHFNHDLRGRAFALWGLAFKPGTDDMREAPSRVLLEALWREGCTVRAYDPAAMNEARRIYGERPDFQALRPSDGCTGAAQMHWSSSLNGVYSAVPISTLSVRCSNSRSSLMAATSTIPITCASKVSSTTPLAEAKNESDYPSDSFRRQRYAVMAAVPRNLSETVPAAGGS